MKSGLPEARFREILNNGGATEDEISALCRYTGVTPDIVCRLPLPPLSEMFHKPTAAERRFLRLAGCTMGDISRKTKIEVTKLRAMASGNIRPSEEEAASISAAIEGRLTVQQLLELPIPEGSVSVRRHIPTDAELALLRLIGITIANLARRSGIVIERLRSGLNADPQFNTEERAALLSIDSRVTEQLLDSMPLQLNGARQRGVKAPERAFMALAGVEMQQIVMRTGLQLELILQILRGEVQVTKDLLAPFFRAFPQIPREFWSRIMVATLPGPLKTKDVMEVLLFEVGIEALSTFARMIYPSNLNLILGPCGRNARLSDSMILRIERWRSSDHASAGAKVSQAVIDALRQCESLVVETTPTNRSGDGDGVEVNSAVILEEASCGGGGSGAANETGEVRQLWANSSEVRLEAGGVLADADVDELPPSRLDLALLAEGYTDLFDFFSRVAPPWRSSVTLEAVLAIPLSDGMPPRFDAVRRRVSSRAPLTFAALEKLRLRE